MNSKQNKKKNTFLHFQIVGRQRPSPEWLGPGNWGRSGHLLSPRCYPPNSDKVTELLTGHPNVSKVDFNYYHRNIIVTYRIEYAEKAMINNDMTPTPFKTMLSIQT